MTDQEDWTRQKVVDEEDCHRQVVVQHFARLVQGHVAELADFGRWGVEDWPKDYRYYHLRRECYLEEYCVPLPRLKDTVLILAIHKVLWRLPRREEAKEYCKPSAPQPPLGKQFAINPRTSMEKARERNFEC